MVRDSYILKLRNGSAWVVKGCCHGASWLTAIPYGARTPHLSHLRPPRLMRTYFSVEPIPVVWLDEVSSVLNPIEWRCDRGVARVACSLIDTLRRELGCRYVGVSGGLLLRGYGHDIDVVVYLDECPGVSVEEVVRVLGTLLKPLRGSVLQQEAGRVAGIPMGFRLLNLASNPLFGMTQEVPVSARIVDCRIADPLCDRKLGAWRMRSYIVIEEPISPYTTPALYRTSTATGGDMLLFSHRLSYTNMGRGTVIEGLFLVEEGMRYGPMINLDRSQVLRIEKFKPFSENLVRNNL